MGLTNKIFFEYGRDANGNISIVGDVPTANNTMDADQNNYMQQRGMQDQLMSSIREDIGMPANRLSGSFFGADEVKILENISELENPDHVMLALQAAPQLDAGTQSVLDTFGKGTPEFRESLHRALKNPKFRESLLSQDGSKEITKMLQEGLPEVEGLNPDEVKTVALKAITTTLNDTGKGLYDGNYSQIPAAVIGSFKTEATKEIINSKVDEFVGGNPKFAELSETLKAYPDVIQAIVSADAVDSTVRPGIEKMLDGTGGLDAGQLKDMLQDPHQRELFIDVMHSVEEHGNVQFDHAVTLANQVKHNDFDGIRKSLDFMKIEAPANLEAGGILQNILQSDMGQKLMSFINPLLEKWGFEGGIHGMLSSMGINFETRAAQSGEGMNAAPDISSAITKSITPEKPTIQDQPHPGMGIDRIISAPTPT